MNKEQIVAAFNNAWQKHIKNGSKDMPPIREVEITEPIIPFAPEPKYDIDTTECEYITADGMGCDIDKSYCNLQWCYFRQLKQIKKEYEELYYKIFKIVCDTRQTAYFRQGERAADWEDALNKVFDLCKQFNNKYIKKEALNEKN